MVDTLIMSKKELQRKSIFDLVKIGELTQKDASKRLGLSYRQIKRTYHSLKKTGTYFPDMKKKPCQNPTARWVFQCFQGVHVLDITQNNINQILVINLKERHQILLNAIRKTFMKIYS